MAVTVEVARDGSQTKLQVHFTDGQRFGTRPGVDAVVAAEVSGHSNSTCARFHEVFAVSYGFLGGHQRAPNFPFFVPQVFKTPRKTVLEFNVSQS